MDKEYHERLKEEITADLGRGYYKMSQSKIITLIGCTITVCLSFFSGLLYIDRYMEENKNGVINCNTRIDETNRNVNDVKLEQKQIRNTCEGLQSQINNK